MAYFTDKFEGKKYFENINFHHLEFYVGNAKQASEYYKNIFGFSDYAYAGPETGLKDRVSYVVRKNKVFYVLTTPLKSNHSISEWLLKHGDGVYDIAFSVDSVRDAYEGCLERGGESVYDLFIADDERTTKISLKNSTIPSCIKNSSLFLSSFLIFIIPGLKNAIIGI